MKVLVGCERSGIVRDAFLALGHEALSCDLEPTDRPGPHHQGDLFDVIDFPWDLAIVHIPCTHSSVSGARHFEAKKMDGRYYAGNALFFRAWRQAMHIPRVCFEHPVSVIASLFRKPDQIIQPWEHGHPETKATALYLRNLPLLVPTDIVEGREARVHRMPPSPERARLRSETYSGIAQASALAAPAPVVPPREPTLMRLLATQHSILRHLSGHSAARCRVCAVLGWTDATTEEKVALVADGLTFPSADAREGK